MYNLLSVQKDFYLVIFLVIHIGMILSFEKVTIGLIPS